MCVRTAVLLQICAITPFTVELGAKKVQRPVFVIYSCMIEQQPICIQMLHAIIYVGVGPSLAFAGNHKTANTFEARLQTDKYL